MFRSKKPSQVTKPNTSTESIRHTPEGQFAADAISGFGAALIREVNKDEVERGVHRTEPLANASEDRFGVATKRWRYVKGMIPANELTKPEVVKLALTTRDSSGTVRAVLLGNTPAHFDPERDGTLIEGTQKAGDYLLSITDLSSRTTEVSYLDGADLAGVRIEHGTPSIQFAGNEHRDQPVVVPGTVQETFGYIR